MHVEVVVVALERRAVNLGHLPHRLAHLARRLVQRIRLTQSLARIEAGPQQVDHRLGQRKTPAAQHHECPLTGLAEGMHLARDIQIVETRVGPRIRCHYQSFMCHDA